MYLSRYLSPAEIPEGRFSVSARVLTSQVNTIKSSPYEFDSSELCTLETLS